LKTSLEQSSYVQINIYKYKNPKNNHFIFFLANFFNPCIVAKCKG